MGKTKTQSKSTKKSDPEPTKKNQATTSAGLIFNVNTFKESMKRHFEAQEIEKPMFQNAHIAMSALVQRMATILAKNVATQAPKDKSDCRTIRRGLLTDSILKDDGLKQFYYMILLKFDKDQTYNESLPIARKELDELFNSIDKRLKFTPKALNLMCYLLLKLYHEVLVTSYEFISFAKRKTLDPVAITFAIKNRIRDTYLTNELCNEVSRAADVDLTETEAVLDNENDKNMRADGGEDSDDGEEVAPKKRSAKKTQPIEESSDSSLSSGSSGSPSASEEEVEAKPKSRKTSNAGGKKKATKTRRAAK